MNTQFEFSAVGAVAPPEQGAGVNLHVSISTPPSLVRRGDSSSAEQTRRPPICWNGGVRVCSPGERRLCQVAENPADQFAWLLPHVVDNNRDAGPIRIPEAGRFGPVMLERFRTRMPVHALVFCDDHRVEPGEVDPPGFPADHRSRTAVQVAAIPRR